MSLLRFGTARILRPSPSVMTAIRGDAREHLFSSFSPGRYSGGPAVNAIIQHQFTFYDSRLREIVSLLASRDAAEFLLFQYDETYKVFRGFGLGDPSIRQGWIEIEGLYRRALKYIVELMCIKRPTGAVLIEKSRAANAMETAIGLAEEAMHLGELSHRVFSLFPEAWTIWITNHYGEHDFDLRISGPHEMFDTSFFARVEVDRADRGSFTGKPQFDIDSTTHVKFLDPAFQRSFGMRYTDFIAVIHNTIEHSRPAPDSFPTLFINRETLLDALVKSSNQPREAIDLALLGFTVQPEHLEAENRVAFRPKQSSRAYRRGFFAFPDETGPHLAFSRHMAQECLSFFVNHVCYRSLPLEWKTTETDNALVDLSEAAGKWFEKTIERNLLTLGIVGRRAKRRIGTGSLRVDIPPDVGELDFLGHCVIDDAIVLIEAKMVLTGLEGSYWRDDVSQFVTGKKSFAVQFRKKISWVSNNLDAIVNALDAPHVRKLQVAMLTLYPCIATEMIDDFACRSLTEFMLDYRKHNRWPYAAALGGI